MFKGEMCVYKQQANKTVDFPLQSYRIIASSKIDTAVS